MSIQGSSSPYQNRREANSHIGVWSWKVSHCPQRSPGHFSTVPLLQATLDEHIIPKKGTLMFQWRQTVMQTPLEPSVSSSALLCPPKPPREQRLRVRHHLPSPCAFQWGLGTHRGAARLTQSLHRASHPPGRCSSAWHCLLPPGGSGSCPAQGWTSHPKITKSASGRGFLSLYGSFLG